MGSLTIRNLDGSPKSRLRIQAAVHGRCMEDERPISCAVGSTSSRSGPRNLGTAIHDLFRPFGGFDMPEVPRDKMREPPWFDGGTGQ